MILVMSILIITIICVNGHKEHKYIFLLKLQAAMNGLLATCSAHHTCCRQGVPRRCIQGKTLYMFEQLGVAGKLYVEVNNELMVLWRSIKMERATRCDVGESFW